MSSSWCRSLGSESGPDSSGADVGLTERLLAEKPLLATTFDGLHLYIAERVIIIPKHLLGAGWSIPHTSVLVEIPLAYPTTPPDNICVDVQLRLANGATPGNTMGTREIAGRSWQQLSYHIEPADWRPHPDLTQSDTLVTYLAGALRRLEEAN